MTAKRPDLGEKVEERLHRAARIVVLIASVLVHLHQLFQNW